MLLQQFLARKLFHMAVFGNYERCIINIRRVLFIEKSETADTSPA
jgi:hypothetical protein